MARHEEGFFSGGDELRLFWESNTPDAPKAHLGIIHGFGDHAGRYREAIDAWVADGFAVHAFDYRGHGRSGGRRGHVDRWGEYLGDLGYFYERVREAAGSTPLFLLGHSHGGLMLVHFLHQSPEGLQGAVLSAPYLALAFKPPAAKVLGAKLVSGVLPWLPFKTGLTPEQLTRDPEMQVRTAEDPLYGDTASPRWFTESNRAQAEALAFGPKIRLPLFMLCGSDDPVASSTVSRKFFESVGSSDKRFKEYPGMRHEVLNEIGREEVYRDVAGWISSHL